MLISHKLTQVVLAMTIITLVTWVGERYRGAAGVLATMPLTIPITLAIVFQNTGGDHARVAEFTQAAVIGIVGTVCFLLAAWWAVTRHYSLPAVIVVGYGAWAIVLIVERTILQLFA
jgi:uncharacterized membrane protein YwzB